MQKISFLHEKRGLWSFLQNLSTIIYYTFSLFQYLIYIQWFRKSTYLEILPFGVTETGGSWEVFFSEEKRKSDEESRKSGFEGTFLPLLKAKMRGVKTQVMRQKWAFSTLISAGKVKRIYRKREKSGRNFRIYWEKKQDKQRQNKIREQLLIHL